MNPVWPVFLVALTASVVLTPLSRSLALRFNAVDRPDGQRKLHAHAVPLLGGVAVYLTLLFTLFVAWQFDLGWTDQLQRLSLVLLLAAGFVCILGCIDDIWDLNSRLKLLLQVVSVLPIVLAGFYVHRIVAFGYPIELGWLGVPLTICWITGCINALNLLDGMDGLASVVGLSTTSMMAIIAASCGQPHVALIAVVLAGALAGFLVYNLPPASVYLGDSGSMVIGLIVGILGIQGAMKTSATLSIAAPVVLMSIPMLDTALAIVRRKLTGRRFDVADRGHIHHRLLDRGLSTWQALWIIGALCLLTGAAATAATILRNDALAWITAVSLVVLLIRSGVFGHEELSLIKLSVATSLAAIANNLVASTRPSRQGIRTKFRKMTFDESWSALIEEVTFWNARRLDVEVASPHKRTACRQWHNPNITAAAGSEFSLTLCFRGDDDTTCKLSIAGPNARMQQSWYLLRLARVMRAFGSYWSAHIELIPKEEQLLQEEPANQLDRDRQLGRAA